MLQGILYETIAVDATGATIRLLPESRKAPFTRVISRGIPSRQACAWWR